MKIRPGSTAAFTMIELVVVLALLVLLAGVMSPLLFQSKQQAQAAKILSMVDGLRKATERFYYDNGRFPADSSVGGGPESHELFAYDSSTGTLPNWKGPYILTPLQNTQNPAAGKILVKTISGGTGVSPMFSLAGGTSLDGSGAAVVFQEVSLDVALLVDQAIDGEGVAQWKSSGQVTYSEASSPLKLGNTSGNVSLGMSGAATSGSGGPTVFGGGSGSGGGGGSSPPSIGGSGTEIQLSGATPAKLNILLHHKLK